MLLIDTSVWISVFRDRTGEVRQKLERLIDDREVFLTRFTQLELLQGSLNEKEWSLLSSYLETQDYVEPTADSWQATARIYYDLRRQGLTVRSPIDCCIAQSAYSDAAVPDMPPSTASKSAAPPKAHSDDDQPRKAIIRLFLICRGRCFL
jgi:predicted nucleic acid-binding protein